MNTGITSKELSVSTKNELNLIFIYLLSRNTEKSSLSKNGSLITKIWNCLINKCPFIIMEIRGLQTQMDRSKKGMIFLKFQTK